MAKGHYPTEKIETEYASLPESVEYPPVRRRFRLPEISWQAVGTFVCTLALIAIGALGMHTVYPYMHPTTFHTAQAYFKQMGQPFRLQRIVEYNRVCPDSNGTPLACLAVDQFEFPAELSMGKPRRMGQ